MDWIISRKKYLPGQLASPDCSYFYSTGNDASITTDRPAVIVDGYILPRLDCPDVFAGLKREELVRTLIMEEGEGFIHRLKGNFVLLVLRAGGFQIFNDIHGMGRFFFWESGDDFVISDSIDTVRAYANAAPDYENLALYCLAEHFLTDFTAFKGVKQSMPSSRFFFDGTLRRSSYWDPASLFTSRREKHLPEYYADRWVRIIKSYVSEPGMKITLTLTGGSDSRLVLAGLMKAGAQISTFTYGDPRSSDGVVAKMVADRLKLDHEIHYNDSPSPDWLMNKWAGIVSIGNTLVNLHRAHRFHAAEEEKKRHPEVEVLFTGLMGGEYLRGPVYDGYIISEYFRKVNHGSSSERFRRTLQMLEARSVNVDILDTRLLKAKLEQISAPFLRKEKEKEFLLSFYIYGCAHHYQDSLIYSSHFRQVVNPFMDPDFLEMAAASEYISFNRKNIIHNLLWASLFQVQLTHLLLPALSDIPYSKKGFYTANDVTGNPMRYLFVRAAGMSKRHSYPSNFRYGNWMKDFAADQLPALSPAIAPLFKMDEIRNRLQHVTTNLSEREWHYFTNPINLGKIFTNEKA